jgi:hypothetical protein
VHRSRLSMLVIFAAAAACTTRDDSQGTEILSQDRTLAAQLKTDQENRDQRLPNACGVVKLAAQPAAANQRQADELTRKAQDAEMHGDIKEAQSLLRRATDLDGTNKSTAYHLGRTSEALGDRDAAMTAYCRYLSLTPTSTESAEARQRVAVLSQTQTPATTQTSGGNVTDSVAAPQPAPVVPARRMARERASVQPRAVASAKVERPVRSTTPTERNTTSTNGAVSVAEDSAPVTQSATEPVNSTPTAGGNAEGVAESKTVGGDVVATTTPATSVEQPSTAPRSTSRGPNRAQNAGIGAAAGGLIGVMAGRSVKSAIIGAAAGGLLGAAMPGRGAVPAGIVPYARQ